MYTIIKSKYKLRHYIFFICVPPRFTAWAIGTYSKGKNNNFMNTGFLVGIVIGMWIEIRLLYVNIM